MRWDTNGVCEQNHTNFVRYRVHSLVCVPMRSGEKPGGEELEGAKVEWVGETGGLLVKRMQFGAFVQASRPREALEGWCPQICGFEAQICEIYVHKFADLRAILEIFVHKFADLRPNFG